MLRSLPGILLYSATQAVVSVFFIFYAARLRNAVGIEYNHVAVAVFSLINFYVAIEVVISDNAQPQSFDLDKISLFFRKRYSIRWVCGLPGQTLWCAAGYPLQKMRR